MSSLAPESQSVRFERDTSQRRRRPSEHREVTGFHSKERRQLVIAFDGTGNRFSGTDADSNILKIFRMLDRDDEAQHHYYQPGIGTYVATSSLSHTSRIARLKSWYMKSKDSAIGTSFAEHVVGGYKVSILGDSQHPAQLWHSLVCSFTANRILMHLFAVSYEVS